MRYHRAGWSVALLFWLLSPCSSFGDETETERLEEQKETLNAYLMGRDGSTISDKEFARWMKTMLAPDAGPIRVHDATFIFQECFGGGMLDDLKRSFGRGVRWIGGSASKHSERAIGKITAVEASKRAADANTPARFIHATPRSTWSEVLVPHIATGQKILLALQAADLEDIVGSHAAAPYLGLEHAQWSSGSGGELNTIDDFDAEERHAILWAGHGNRWRHYHNIAAMRAMLIAKWGAAGRAYSITIFYGIGNEPKDPDGDPLPTEWHAKPGTNTALRLHLINETTLNMNTFAQFFFYATGHGGSSTKMPPPPAVLTPGTVDSIEFEVSPFEMNLMSQEPGNEPLVAVMYQDYMPGTGEATVTVNGVLLGTIPPVTEQGTLTTVEFVVAESLLTSVNTLVITNNSDVDLSVEEFHFNTGGVDDDPPVGVADFDGDGDADAEDLATFELCMSGPDIPYWPDLPAGCTQAPNASNLIASDFDRDGDVDLSDFGVFQRCLSGEEWLAHPDCAY